MALYLGDEDLDQRHANLDRMLVGFEHFKPEVQQTIRLVGKAWYITKGIHRRIAPPQ